ncbi:MAG TPA: DEAD/DEAH box helicase, partial [Sedimentisphaerales bacterium]|nr:DEAD/DEAH box helicase [Sedimentisphaerales bacterium]
NGPDLPEADIASLPIRMQEAVARAGWKDLMPVQARAIPYMLAGRDIMVQSRTGSGKTGAFILPVIERIKSRQVSCQAIVLVPTRELARQVAAESEMLCGDTGIRTVSVYGGVGYGQQIEGFRRGAHIVVGTPGRVLDHLLRKTLVLDHLETLVFDEADRMLSMGFYPDMKRVQSYLPKRRLHGCMFSATFPPYVMRLASEFLRDPEFLSLSKDHVHVADTEHVYYKVPAMDKDRCLMRIIESENPASAIIFCNTKSKVHYVATVLQRFGYDADELSADLSQAARDSVMSRLRAGTLKFLVATDVAARGIDIPDLSHVFQYEPPEDQEGYIHRAGRTGRAGAAGEAITLVSGFEEVGLKQIAKKYKIELIERSVPADADIAAIVSQRLTVLLEAKLRSRDRVEIERLQRFIELGRALAQSEEELPIIAMLLDDYYLQSLHAKLAAQEVPGGPEAQPQAKRHEGRRREEGKRSSRRRSKHRSRGG